MQKQSEKALRTQEGDDNIHKRFDALIPAFFDDRLSPGQLSRFLHHYDTCAECREELSIQLLISQGLARMESGEAFNLEEELDACVEKERIRLERRQRAARLAAFYEIMTLSAFAAAVIFYIMFWA